MAIDPICGMTVDESTALTAERDGETFYFCCDHCRRKFLDDGTEQATDNLVQLLPATSDSQEQGRYICPMCEGVESDRPGDCPKCGMALETAQPAAPRQKTIYTCPMHPEIEEDQPGTCPKCGMDLEPKTIEASDEEDDSELRSMTRRFWISLGLSVPVLLLAMLPMLHVPVDEWLGHTVHVWLQLVLSTPVVLWAGWPFFVRGWRSIATLEPQHVYADLDRHGSGVPLQPGRRAAAGPHSR